LSYNEKSNIIIAIQIDTKNKWGEIFHIGTNENNIPCIGLEANKNTTNIKKDTRIGEFSITEIQFPEYAGGYFFI